MNNRYIIQEMNESGFTHYEIIDTKYNCKTVFKNKDYTRVIEELKRIRNNTYIYEPNNNKWYTREELANIIKTIGNYTLEQALLNIQYSIEQGILYDYNGYVEHFKPYEN